MPSRSCRHFLLFIGFLEPLLFYFSRPPRPEKFATGSTMKPCVPDRQIRSGWSHPPVATSPRTQEHHLRSSSTSCSRPVSIPHRTIHLFGLHFYLKSSFVYWFQLGLVVARMSQSFVPNTPYRISPPLQFAILSPSIAKRSHAAPFHGPLPAR